MKYQHTETVDAFTITAVSYTLDDGTTRVLATGPEVGAFLVTDATGTETVRPRDAFLAEFTPAPLD